MCEGVPGKLEIVSRMLNKNQSLNDLRSEKPDVLPEFIAIEWDQIKDSLSKTEREAIAIIAISKKKITKNELSKYSELRNEEVITIVDKFDFIEFDASKEKISFISEAHRKFAKKQVADFTETAHEKIINSLLTNFKSQNSIQNLPDYLEDSKKYKELISCLNEDYYQEALKQTESLNFIQKRAEQGLKSAINIDDLSSLFKFSLQKSLMLGLLKANILKSEVEARLFVEDHERALALAQSSLLKEDRLHLLSIIAKYFKKNNIDLDDEIIEQINLLSNQIDTDSLGQKSVEIASNLIWINPDLAIDIVEKSNNISNENGKNNIDLAFAKLSVEAFNAQSSEANYKDVVEKTTEKNSDPGIQNFLNAASLFAEDFSTKKLIAKVEDLEVKNRLFILRQWILNNRDNKEITEIVEYSLDQLVSTTNYTPKLRDLREISTPLPKVNDPEKAKKLVGRIDSLINSMHDLGTTIDYVRLQIVLGKTELNIGATEASYHRIIELYWDICNINNLSIRTESIAWFLSEYQNLDPDKVIEENEQLLTVLQESLDKNIDSLLKSTASHYQVTKDIIKALSKNHPQKGLEIAKSLNTQSKRDKALFNFLKRESKKKITNINFDLIINAHDEISHQSKRDKALLMVVENINNSDIDNIDRAIELKPKIENVSDHQTKVLVYSHFISLISCSDSKGKYKSLVEYLFKKLDETWKEIDTAWIKVDAGFLISKILSKYSKDVGAKYLNKTEEFKKNLTIYSQQAAITYTGSIRIAIRAFAGLLDKDLFTNSDIERIEKYINKIPSNGERVAIWTDFALRCYSRGNNELGTKITNQYVRDIIESTPKNDQSYYHSIISNAAPALYQAHENTALDLIKKLPQEYQETAISNTIEFIFRKKPLDDPFNNSPNGGYKINHQNAVDILKLLEYVDTDKQLYNHIVQLVNSLNSKDNKQAITRQQKADLAHSLIDITESKLPDKKNINHKGYLISAKAYLFTLLRTNQKDWQELVSEAQKIPNKADKVYVLGIIASNLRKNKEQRDNLLDDVEKIIKQIPSKIDQVSRKIHIANLFADKNTSISKKSLKSAMVFTKEEGEDEGKAISQRQKNIIDLAHKIDPNFASSLINLMDNDPARNNARNPIKERLTLLNTKKTIAEEDNSSSINKEHYAQAAWMNLGSLNANRLHTMHKESFNKHFEESSELDIYQSYAVLSWLIENAIIRYSNTEEAENIFYPIFNSSLLSSELTTYIISSNQESNTKVKQNIQLDKQNKHAITIKEGERDKAFNFIRSWIKDNVNNYLKVCDPYFGLQELNFLKLVKNEKPNCKISILTSKRHQEKSDIPYQEKFNTYWNLNISEAKPPFTKIVIVSLGKSGKSPIHDRWLISDKSGLKLGTSLNSIGTDKVSDISIFSNNELDEKEFQLNQYLNNQKFEQNNERVSYNTFKL